MSAHVSNLIRAANFIRRFDTIEGLSEWEGVPLSEIAADCLLAANDLHNASVRDSLIDLARPDNVIPIDTFSRKVSV